MQYEILLGQLLPMAKIEENKKRHPSKTKGQEKIQLFSK